MTPPWDDKLATAFPDAEQRAAVDAFLRSDIQPYVTRLETDFAGTENARQLYADLTADDDAEAFKAFVGVTQELYGEEGAQALLSAMAAEQPGPAEPATTTEPPADTPLSLDKLPPEVQRAVERDQQRASNETYDEELLRIKGGLPEGTELNDGEFALSVLATGGDFDKALEHYNERSAQWAPPAPEPETPPAPEALGDGLEPQPVEEKYDTMDDAMDAFLKEIRPQAPPAVGTV